MGNLFVKFFFRPSNTNNNDNIFINEDYSSDDSELIYPQSEPEIQTYYIDNNLSEPEVNSSKIKESEEEPEEEPEEEEEQEEYSKETQFFSKSGKKKALLIGINYSDDNIQDNDLYGCVNDLNNIENFLIETCNFKIGRAHV